MLASNDIDLLIETKQMLHTHFDIKGLGHTFHIEYKDSSR